jgi:alkanesulfonate monooxygenase SsuD/methylene tetrahydromethanopterin reductase-like flavin-dependent oxidoreductase (luciferase family)
MTDLKIGLALWSQAATWQEMATTARRADQLGYDSLWTWDHLLAIMGDPDQPILEGYTVLAGWAGITTRIRLGLMVGANTFRNPGLVAKAITTLDHISGGRAYLGLGGAWFELEHRAYGIEFGTGSGMRLDWLEESVSAIRTLLDGGTVTSPPGGHYRFDGLRQLPLPVQPHLPILIGGNGRRKTLRTTARHADAWNGFGTVEAARELIGVLDGHCVDVGRDPTAIERTINLWMVIRDDPAEARRVWDATTSHNRAAADDMIDDPRPLLGPPELIAEELRRYVEVGMTGTIVELPAPYDSETLERLIGEVKPLVDRG